MALRDENVYSDHEDGTEDSSVNALHDKIKAIQDRINLVKHNNQMATELISDIVMYFQNIVFVASNRSLGPIIINLRHVLPHLLHPDDPMA